MKKYILLILLVIILDQTTKYLFYNLDFLSNLDIFQYHILNTGISWGVKLIPQLTIILLTIVILGLLINEITKEDTKEIYKYAFALIVGGGLGNLLDRFFYHGVRDFITIKIPIVNYYFPTFNLSDTFITLGALLIIIGFFTKK